MSLVKRSFELHRGATVGVLSNFLALRKVPGPWAESAVALSAASLLSSFSLRDRKLRQILSS